MPQFGDQFINAAALEATGGGLSFKLREATEERVLTALKKVLSPEMRQNMSDLSKRFKDRPLSPMDTAIYWIEYVARHKGALHMRTAAVDLQIYQYLLLFVIAFLFFVLLSIMYMLYKIGYVVVEEGTSVANAMNAAIVWGPVNGDNLHKFTFKDKDSAGFSGYLYENFYNKSTLEFYEYFVDDDS
ncbi:hypothetical protein JTB14_025747 [Gonioctena quinquepunctata]|nr:hypothetical protein JTB14_025747 [Gonioctena quinquepunctata]